MNKKYLSLIVYVIFFFFGVQSSLKGHDIAKEIMFEASNVYVESGMTIPQLQSNEVGIIGKEKVLLKDYKKWLMYKTAPEYFLIKDFFINDYLYQELSQNKKS